MAILCTLSVMPFVIPFVPAMLSMLTAHSTFPVLHPGMP